MKQLLVFVVLSFSLLSCQNQVSNTSEIDTENMSEVEIEEVLEKTTVTYSRPIYADSSDYILIPLAHDTDYDVKTYSSLKNKRKTLPNYWNIIFYRKNTGKTHLLTQNKIGIQQIFVQEQQEMVNHNTIPHKILYEIKDLSYADNDQYRSQLFSSNLDGSDFKQISPKHEALAYFEIMPTTNDIFLQTVQDVNQDSIFDQEDKNILYKATLDKNEWKVSEMIPSAERSQLQKLYLDQWVSK